MQTNAVRGPGIVAATSLPRALSDPQRQAAKTSKNLKWTEGNNIRIDIRWGTGEPRGSERN